MKKRYIKLIAVSLVFLQLAMPAFPAFVRADSSVPQDGPLTSVQQLKGISSFIVIINSNISEQLRRIVELSCIASTLAQTQSPLQKKSAPASQSYSPSIVTVNSFSSDNTVKSFTFINDLDGKVFENMLMLCALFAIIVFLDRVKWKQYFFLLPRGTTDDIILSINSFGINPHWLYQMRVFSLSASTSRSYFRNKIAFKSNILVSLLTQLQTNPPVRRVLIDNNNPSGGQNVY